MVFSDISRDRKRSYFIKDAMKIVLARGWEYNL